MSKISLGLVALAFVLATAIGVIGLLYAPVLIVDVLAVSLAILLLAIVLLGFPRGRSVRDALGAALILSGFVVVAGCAKLQQIEANLASPQATQAAANLKNFVAAGTCFVADVSTLEDQIATLVKANQAAISTSNKVCVASAVVCQSLGGTLSPGNCQ